MKEIQLGKDKFHVPETWAECTSSQVVALSACSVLPEEHRKYSAWELIIKTGLGCSDEFWKKLTLGIDQWNFLKHFFSWIFTEKIAGKPFESFEHNGIVYILPKEHFDDSDAIEVSMGAVLFTEFADATTPNLKALDELIATLCRPVRIDLEVFKLSDDWDGDSRELYNQARSKERATEFESLGMGVKVAFLHYFEAMFRGFMEEYEELFGNNKSEPRYGDGRGWLMVLKNMAKKGIFGDLKGVQYTNVHWVWGVMLDDFLDEQEAPEADSSNFGETNEGNE